MLPELVGDGVLIAGDAAGMCTVSYTHLDVYKRQVHSTRWQVVDFSVE